MKREIITKNVEETQLLAEKILKEIEKEKINVIFLQGNLGAGKTTFCQEILRLVGAEEPFTSPTFVIMKKYELKNKQEEFQAVFHIDCYRIGENDMLDLGWQEIIEDEKNLVLVEWPEKIQKIWPKKYLKLTFQMLGEKERKITIENLCAFVLSTV